MFFHCDKPPGAEEGVCEVVLTVLSVELCCKSDYGHDQSLKNQQTFVKAEAFFDPAASGHSKWWH